MDAPRERKEITELQNDEFLSAIREQLDLGYSMTPFLGSGVSAPSGILMGLDFDIYLAYVVYLVLTKKWDIRNNGWPARPTKSQSDEARKTMLTKYEQCLSRYNCTAVKGENKEGQQIINHVVSRTYDVKLLATDDTEDVPQSGNRLVLISKVRQPPSEPSVKVTVFKNEKDSYQFDISTSPLSEHLKSLLDQHWNQTVPDRTKYDVLSALRSELSNDRPSAPPGDEKRSLASIISDEEMPKPSAHRLSIQMKRPLVPNLLRSPRLKVDEPEFDDMRRQWGIDDFPSDPNQSLSSRSYIEDMALRSLAHWTRTLEFLAQVLIGRRNSSPWLGERDSSVIDNFNAHITRGRHPNLIHNMIARLSRSLRTRIVLTTNFDTLIEQSYRAQGEPLHVLAVSIKGGLPAYATVRAQDCLVKLHGDILETRADTSIDEPPTKEDKDAFYRYLQGNRPAFREQPPDIVPSHLLVVGYSANDARCVQMIKYVMDLEKEKFKVYWICYSQSDLETIKKVFGEYKGQIFPTVTDRADLLLWELYQTVNLTLPGGGYSFQFSHLVPPQGNDSQNLNTSALEMEIKTITKETEDKRANVVWIDAESGVSRQMSPIFKSLRNSWISAIWFELEDFASPYHLLSGLFTAIAMRRGNFQLEWFSFPPLDEDTTTPKEVKRQVALFVERYAITPQEWAFFLYGRNGPGGCCGWNLSYWNDVSYERMGYVLSSLADVGFRVIYMAYGTMRAKRNHGPSTLPIGGKAQEINDIVESAKNKEKCSLALESDYTAWAKLCWKHLGEFSAINPVVVPDADTHNIPSPRKGYQALSTSFERSQSSKSYSETIVEVLRSFSLSDEDLSDPLPVTERSRSRILFSQKAKRRFDVAPTKSRRSTENLTNRTRRGRGKCSTTSARRSVRNHTNMISETEYRSIRSARMADQKKRLELQSKHQRHSKQIRVMSARMLWLYGITLFRQSRHSASLLSESVFPCPFKFNNGKDNDEFRHLFLFGDDGSVPKRAESYQAYHACLRLDIEDPFYNPEIVGWVEHLRKSELFLRKPGGYAWKYRDTRLGLQYALEQSPNFVFFDDCLSWNPDDTGSVALPARRTDSIWRIRGRIHFWIGDWYLRAYHSTLHHLPLVEAIYHSVQAIIHAPYYEIPYHPNHRPSEEAQQKARLRLAWRSVCQVRKLIHTGKRSLHFWMPGADIWKVHFHGLEKTERSGYALDLTSVAELADLRDNGRSVVIVALVGADLHIRIFDADSRKIVDKPESELVCGRSLTGLKESLCRIAFTNHPPLASEAKRNFIEQAISISSNDLDSTFRMLSKHLRPILLKNCSLSNRLIKGLGTLNREIKMLQISVQSEGRPHGERCIADMPSENKPTYPPFIRNLTHSTEIIRDEQNWLREGLLQDGLNKIGFFNQECRIQSTSFFSTIESEDPQLDRVVRACRATWITEWMKDESDERQLITLVWLLAETAYRICRRAKLLRYANKNPEFEKSESSKEQARNYENHEQKLWTSACAVAHLTLQLSRNISPQYYSTDCELRIQVLTIYGMALGYLGRFKESHRRFNEAHALLVSGLRSTERKELAKIHLRRAETSLAKARDLHRGYRRQHMDEKEWQKDFGRSEIRPMIACIDEAWAALERANLSMTGTNHSGFWWFRLISLRLKVYAFLSECKELIWNNEPDEHGLPRCLPFRRRLHYPSILVELLRDALILGEGDLFRQLRVIDHFFLACRLQPAESSNGTKGLYDLLRPNSERRVKKPADRINGPVLLLRGKEEGEQDIGRVNAMIKDVWRELNSGRNPKEDALHRYFDMVDVRIKRIAFGER